MVKNAQELRRGIAYDSRLFVGMPRGGGTLKEIERNGETQNRRSGSRGGVNDDWGCSSVKGGVERIHLRQHHQQQDNGYRKPQQEQPGWGNGPPQHSDMFRQTPAEVNPLKDPSGWNPVPISQTEPPCQVAAADSPLWRSGAYKLLNDQEKCGCVPLGVLFGQSLSSRAALSPKIIFRCALVIFT
jgi:hypothetical protein